MLARIIYLAAVAFVSIFASNLYAKDLELVKATDVLGAKPYGAILKSQNGKKTFNFTCYRETETGCEIIVVSGSLSSKFSNNEYNLNNKMRLIKFLSRHAPYLTDYDNDNKLNQLIEEPTYTLIDAGSAIAFRSKLTYPLGFMIATTGLLIQVSEIPMLFTFGKINKYVTDRRVKYLIKALLDQRMSGFQIETVFFDEIVTAFDDSIKFIETQNP